MQSKHLIAIFALIITFIGCSSKAQEGKVIAEVNGHKLTQEYLMDQIPKDYQASLTQEDLAKAIDTWIETQLLYDEALKHNLDKDKQVQNFIDQTTKTIIARKYLDTGIAQNLNVTDAEIDSVYNTEKDKFANNEESYGLSHIVLKAAGPADAVYKRLQNGEDFTKLVTDYSEDTASIKRGGDLGFLPASALEKGMIDALNNTAIGKFTVPIKSQSGYYHIFLLKDKRTSGTTMPLAEVKNDIAQAIGAKKQQSAYDELLKGLKEKAQIKRYPLSENQEKK
jgi:EpsD family peptidyl-prolyl cis-trans isomerase